MSTAKVLPSNDKKRVVIIDDNTDVADSLAQWLTLAQHEVATAYTGATGIELVSKMGPDIVLLDIGLPDQSGYDIAQHLDSIRSSLPPFILVAVTGYGQCSDTNTDSVKHSGFDYYFTKPLDVEKLRSIGLKL